MNYKNVNDYEVLYMIRENSDDARDIMFEKYFPIIKKIASKFYLINKDLGADFDDYVQEGLIAFNRAILTYDEKKNVLFYTYAPNVINKHLLSFVRNLKVEKHTILSRSLHNEEILHNVKDYASFDYMDKSIEEEFVKLKYSLDYKFSTVFELRFNGFTYKEIACLLDIPVSTVQSRLAKIKKILHDNLQKVI